MKLKKLTIENVRTYENQEINFPAGSTLLSGDIGSGKTTILLAVEFALFGLQPTQKASSLMRIDKNDCRIILEFEIDGKNIEIQRSLKRGKKSITQDYASLIIDSQKYEGSVTEIKNKILGLLNYPKEFSKKTNLLYKFTVYTPQEEMKQIILESGEIRLNTLRHVFAIDKYKRIEENTEVLTSRLREKIRINESHLQNIDELKEDLKNRKENLLRLKLNLIEAETDLRKVEQMKFEHENSLKDIQVKIDEKRNLETEKAKSDILLSEKNQQIKSLEAELFHLNLSISEDKNIHFNQEEIGSTKQRIIFKKNKLEEFHKEYMQVLSRTNSQKSKKYELENLKNKISALENCPTCLQQVSSDYKKNIMENVNQEMILIEKSIEQLSKIGDKLSSGILESKSLIQGFEKNLSELELLKIKQETIKEKESRIKIMETNKKTLIKDTEILKKHLLTIEKSIRNYEIFDIIYQEKNKELSEIKKSENLASIKKAEINKEIQFLTREMEIINKEIEKKQSLKIENEKIKEIEFWLSSKFIEIILFTEKQVMITLKEEFSRLFSKWFSTLVSDSLTGKIDDDFSPVIEQQDYELDYSFLSGGERTAVALAYRLSLNQVINSLLSNLKTSNIVILDEPTDGFSAQQLDKMRDVLNQLNTEQLILVSHEPKIEGFVDNIIRVKKEGGISTIDQS